MRDGRVRQEGAPAEVYASPVDPWVARFVGEANLLPGRSDDDRVASTAVGQVPVTPGGPRGDVTVLVRPEHLDLSPGRGATVTDVAFYGHDSSYTVRLGEQVLTVRAAAAPRFGVGDDVHVRFGGPRTSAYAAGT